MNDWRGVLSDAFVGGGPNAPLDISMSGGAEQVRLRVRSDGLEFVGSQEGHEPDLTIRLRTLEPNEVLLGTAATRDVFRDAELAVGDRWWPALPAAEEELPRSEHFERVPGASLSAAILVTSTVFGEVGMYERWEDGALVSSELVPVSQLEHSGSDVRMSCSLGELAAIRRRELSPLDALAGGVGLMGDWPQLMCFAELLQHPAYLSVWEADSTVEAQSAWGAIFSSSAYGNAALRAQPDPVVAS